MEKILKNRFKLVRTIEYHLGTGSCSEVYLGKDLQTNSSVAIKIIQKYFDIFAETQTIAISTEKKVLKICESPHTNKLIDDFEDDQNYYLFFELCDGDLEALLRKKGPFKVEDIRKIFIQLNQVFSIMNNNQIIHRDLKLANVLYTYTNSQQTDFDVELSDFGVSKILQEGVTRSFKGTIYSMAPEIIEGDDYTTKADLWSIGIMMYQLLLKKNPFPARNQEELLKMIYTRRPAKDIKNFRLTDLVGKLLTPDPNKRISWEEYFKHPFFKVEKLVLEDKLIGQYLWTVVKLVNGNNECDKRINKKENS